MLWRICISAWTYLRTPGTFRLLPEQAFPPACTKLESSSQLPYVNLLIYSFRGFPVLPLLPAPHGRNPLGPCDREGNPRNALQLSLWVVQLTPAHCGVTGTDRSQSEMGAEGELRGPHRVGPVSAVLSSGECSSFPKSRVFSGSNTSR